MIADHTEVKRLLDLVRVRLPSRAADPIPEAYRRSIERPTTAARCGSTPTCYRRRSAPSSSQGREGPRQPLQRPEDHRAHRHHRRARRLRADRLSGRRGACRCPEPHEPPCSLYPEQAEFERVLPKNKIYGHAKPSRAMRQRFVDQVEEIIWRYKLAPETLSICRPSPGDGDSGLRDRPEDAASCRKMSCGLSTGPFRHYLFFELTFEGRSRFAAPTSAPAKPTQPSTSWRPTLRRRGRMRPRPPATARRPGSGRSLRADVAPHMLASPWRSLRGRGDAGGDGRTAEAASEPSDASANSWRPI